MSLLGTTDAVTSSSGSGPSQSTDAPGWWRRAMGVTTRSRARPPPAGASPSDNTGSPASTWVDMGHKWEDSKDHRVRVNPGSAAASAKRSRPHLGFAVLLIFFAGQLVPFEVLPRWLLQLCLMSGVTFMVYKIATFPRWADENAHVLRFLACFVAMLIELAWENGMVWIVSATDKNKYEDVEPLQDNVEIAFKYLAEHSSLIHWLIHWNWVAIAHFLLAVLALAFSVIWEQVPFSGFGMMARMTLTICLSRIIRVASFMCTVLPSPMPGCYSLRFPPVPPTTWGIIKEGYTAMRGFGGCNDLVFSGHAAFWALAPLMFRTYYPKYRWVSVFLWVAFTHTSLTDVMNHQHYSVDMLLAVVVTAAVWTWLAWVYDPAERALPPRPPGAPPDKPHWAVLVLLGIVMLMTFSGILISKS